MRAIRRRVLQAGPRILILAVFAATFCVGADGLCAEAQQEGAQQEETRVVNGPLQVLNFLGSLLKGETPKDAEKAKEEAKFEETHKQVATIVVNKSGKPTVLNTFCLDREGNILAACGGTKVTYAYTAGRREAKTTTHPNEIRVFSPEGKLLKTWKVDVAPQAINVAPDGEIYVSGTGRIARLNVDGETLAVANTPQIRDMKAFREEARKFAESMNERMKSQYTQMIDRYKQTIEKITAKPADERTATEKAQLKSTELQLKSMEQIVSQQFSEAQLTSMMNYKMKVSGVAVTDKDVFVAVPAVKGYGYDVWRTDRDFKNSKQVVTSLRGCCGQMDIQAGGDELFVAHNARHQVERYDRDGKLLSKWGKRDRTGVEGFGGCCNPMNLRLAANGDVFTSESSPLRVKRYSPDGKLLSVVGATTLSAGCKHVAVGVSQDCSRVYMLDVNGHRILALDRKETAKAATGGE